MPRGLYHRTSTLGGVAGDGAQTAVVGDDGSWDGGREGEAGSEPPSLHVTIGVETDTDDWTWLSLLVEASESLRLPNARSRLEHAQWTDERLREALPLPLCRPTASLDGLDPSGAAWLARAQEALREHVGGTPPSQGALRRALEAALAKRADLVERKRRQLIDFMKLSPPVL